MINARKDVFFRFYQILAIFMEPFTALWNPKVCRIIAFYGFWAIISPILGGLRYGFMEPPDPGRSSLKEGLRLYAKQSCRPWDPG